MNYYRIYNELISSRRTNPASGYTENHHILPSSLGGGNEPENLISLTGREHWVAHLLLHKIHRLPSTAQACHCMAMKCEERGIPKIRNSRMYQHIRESLIPIWSANGKRRIGSANGSYGTRWICNVGLQENKKISKDAIIPEGWVAGRNIWVLLKKQADRKIQSQKEKEKEKRAIEKEHKKWYDKYLQSGKSCREYAKSSNFPYSHVTLSSIVNKYNPR
jgi:hypothetical protein